MMRWFRQRIAAQQARSAARHEQWVAEQEEARRHERRLEVAIGIGSVVIVAHADTWQEMVARARTFTLWPGETAVVEPQSDGMVKVRIGGKHVMTFLWSAKHDIVYGRTAADRAIGRRIYTELARTVDAVGAVTNPGAAIPPIVLDARMADASS